MMFSTFLAAVIVGWLTAVMLGSQAYSMDD